MGHVVSYVTDLGTYKGPHRISPLLTTFFLDSCMESLFLTSMDLAMHLLGDLPVLWIKDSSLIWNSPRTLHDPLASVGGLLYEQLRMYLTYSVWSDCTFCAA